MHKRSSPSTHQPLDYQSRTSSNGYKNLQTQDQLDNSIDRFINDVQFIRVLNKRGITKLFPIQLHTFRTIYEGYDLIARDRTGSGKTLAFTLPIIERLRQKNFQHRQPKFLIILPTRQLAIQVNNQIESLRYLKDDFKTLVVYGKSSIENNIYKLKEGVDILVGTPGRLNDLIERGEIKLSSLEVLCLDEADQILKQGFKEQIDKIFRKITQVNRNKIQYLMFSATVPQWLRKLSQQFQSKNVAYVNLIKQQQISTSRTIKHLAVQVDQLNQSQIAKLIQQIVNKYGGNDKRILIFCDKKAQVDNLSKNLKIYNDCLHGDVPQGRRQKVYRSFKNDSLKCIVATNVAARGLDFPSVDLVIQMTPPMKTQDYIHRAGRTGRAGKQGTCLTFFTRMSKRGIFRIQNQAKIKIQQIKVQMENSFNNYHNNDNSRNNGNGYNRDNNNQHNRQNGYNRERSDNPRRQDQGNDRRNNFQIDKNQNYDSERRYNQNRGQGNQNRYNREQSKPRDPRPSANNYRDRNILNQQQQRGSFNRNNEQRSANNRSSPSNSRSRSSSPKEKSVTRYDNKNEVKSSSHYQNSSPKRQEKKRSNGDVDEY